MGTFVNSETGAKTYAAGYFLASEDCKRVTIEAAQNKGTTVGSTKYIPAGTVYPSNDGNAKGIIYEDVDVTNGDAPASLVIEGTVYEDRLPAAIESAAEAVLTGIKVITTSPAVTRPAWIAGDMIALSVSSAAGSSSGKTKITVSGYTLKVGESYKYKTNASTAPEVTKGQTNWTGWTAWNGTSDITATSTHKITIAVVDNGGAGIGSGSATVTSA